MTHTASRKKPDFAWHVHHGILCEPLIVSLEERIAFIKACKPPREHELRLRLLKPVQGKLPEEYVEAWAAYDKAWAAYKEEIEELHRQECPDCPWNGETIFLGAKEVPA